MHRWFTEKFKGQRSESFRLGAILATVGGFLDAYTFILRGGVFSNAQTGNIALLGICLAEGQWSKSVLYLIPILAFVVGIILVEQVKSRFKNNPQISVHWRQIVVVFEAVVLLVIAFIPQGRWDIFVNVLVSFVCSLQVESFRKIHGDTYVTTMCTGNLRSATELFCRYNELKDENIRIKSLKYYGVILFFVLGAIMGTILSNLLGILSVLFCIVLLGIVFFIMR